ncbi:MAG TPA: glycoside-pentoside-hexuronide (GPH):cation symporter [Propionibacteriaceae bacterium]|nr:glycoside-pentoside-hexuronide (GPH):cation symporter [Propionibacteriaceae bacterium]
MSAVATQPASKPFGFRDKIGYALGDMGNDFSFILASAFLMIFYTNVLGVKAAEVGTLLLVVRLADAFVDVTIGRLVDRSALRPAGRFRPWIARFGLPVAVASALMYFFGAAGWAQGAKVVYILVTYALWSVLYSAINIPYGSMAAVVTSDPVQRSSLSVFRTFGAFLAQLVIVFTVPLLIFTKDAAGKTQVVGHAFLWVGIAAAVVSIVSYYGCYQLSTERVRIEPKAADKATGIGRTLADVFRNRSMQAIIAAALLLLIAMMMISNMTSYLWAIYFNNGQMQSTAATLALLPTLLLLPVATPLARRFGKREVSIVAVGGAGAVYVLLYLVNLQAQPWGFVVATIVAGLGLGLFNMLIWAFITDVIDDHEVRSGERADGVVYSVYSWARKVGQALAFGLGGWSLGWIGYQAGTTAQSPTTVKGIYMLMTLVPGVLFALVAVVLLFWYPLSKKVVLENAATLARRHQQPASPVETASLSGTSDLALSAN